MAFKHLECVDRRVERRPELVSYGSNHNLLVSIRRLGKRQFVCCCNVDEKVDESCSVVPCDCFYLVVQFLFLNL